MTLVPPRRIERHPPVLQTGAQTTYAREAIIGGTPRENRTPTKRFGDSCATTTPAGQLRCGGRPWNRTRNVYHEGPDLCRAANPCGTVRRCTRHSTKTPDSSTASKLLKSNRTACDTDLPIVEGFPEPKSTKPGFLAEIRASAFVAAWDGWPTPFVVPPGCSLCPDSTNNRGLDGQSACCKNWIADQFQSSPRVAAGSGR